MTYSTCFRIVLTVVCLLITPNVLSEESEPATENSKQKSTVSQDADAAALSTAVSTQTTNSEPGVAVIPSSRTKPSASIQQTKLNDLIRKLRGPEGLLHLDALTAFVHEWPENTLARLWLVKGLIQTNQIDKAVIYIGEPGKWQEVSWQVAFWKANVHIMADMLIMAESETDITVAADPKNADAWVQRAVLQQELGNHAGAIQLLNIALSLEPDHALANLNLGYSYEHKKNLADALVAYRKFLTGADPSLMHLRVKVIEQIELLARQVVSSEHSAYKKQLHREVDSAAN